MNKLLIPLSMTIVLFSGCRQTLDDGMLSIVQLAHQNQKNSNLLSPGLAKRDVIRIMGLSTAQTKDGYVSNPFRSETFQDKAESQYEVLYYVTEKNRMFQPLRNNQTTPVILKDGKLIGWGAEALLRAKDHVTKQIDISIEHR